MRTCSLCSGLTPAGDTCLHCDAPLPPRRGRKLAMLLAATTGSVLLAACYGPAGKYRTQDPDQGSAAQPGSAAPPTTPTTPTPGSAAPLPQPG